MQITKVGLKHNLSSAKTRFHDVNFLWWTSIHFYTSGRKVFLFGRSVNKSKAFFQPITNSKNTVVWVSSTNFPNQLKYQKMLLWLWSKMGVVFQHKISTTDRLWVLLKVFFCLNWIKGPVDQSKDEIAIVGVCERICYCLNSEQGLSSLFNSPWRSFYQGA